MNTPESTEPFDDGRPFVIEICGDDLWDDVLAQPPYNPAQHNVQITENTSLTNDRSTQADER